MNPLGFRKKPETFFLKVSARRELEDAIAIKLAGRAAEEAVFGREEMGPGSCGDLNQATKIATKMVAVLGFGERTGPLSLDEKAAKEMPDVLADVAQILAVQYDRTLQMVVDSRPVLDRLAGSLVDQRCLSAQNIRQIIER